ncbi:MAG: hypothetical protein J0665_08910 [Deltaproteobacteria bacterium]|nr:hypothetical protein [Deltaproteobacteria bacterium]
MNYKKKIKNSPLAFRINSISKEVFTIWLENAKTAYNLKPDLINKIQNDKFEDVFLNYLSDAIKILVEDKSLEKKTVPGWSFGYVCGNVQGKLEVTWYNKYILEASIEYENILKIKAVIEYFKLDTLLLDKIGTIYSHLLEQRVQPSVDKCEVSPNLISIFKYKNKNNSKIDDFKSSIVELLSTDIQAKILTLLNLQHYDCCPDLDKYFNFDEIVEIAGHENFA